MLFITESENINLSDSLLFLTCARQALNGVVKRTRISESKRRELSSFIMREASDYEIMSLVTYGVLPEQKYDSLGETYVWSDFKIMMMENFDLLTEMFAGREAWASEFINETGPVFEFGLGSAEPILEFSMAHLNEIWPFKKKTEAEKEQEKEEKDSEKIKKGLKKGLRKNRISSLGGGIKGHLKYAGERVAAGGEKATGASHFTNVYKNVRAGTDPISNMQNKGTGRMQALKAGAASWRDQSTKTQKATVGITAAAIAAAAIYASVKIYQRIFSQASRACKGSKGAEREACVRNFKNKAIQAQMSNLKGSMGKCSAAKDPDKCKAGINEKIMKLQGKIR